MNATPTSISGSDHRRRCGFPPTDRPRCASSGKVSRAETVSFKAWNSRFQGMKLTVSRRETNGFSTGGKTETKSFIAGAILETFSPRASAARKACRPPAARPLSVPLHIISGCIRRHHADRVFKGVATDGKGTTGRCHGFRLHFTCNDREGIIGFRLTGANVDDRSASTTCSGNTAKTIHSRHRPTSNFLMNPAAALAALNTPNKRHCYNVIPNPRISCTLCPCFLIAF